MRAISYNVVQHISYYIVHVWFQSMDIVVEKVKHYFLRESVHRKVNKPFASSFARNFDFIKFFYTKQSTIIDAVESSSGEIEIGLKFLEISH